MKLVALMIGLALVTVTAAPLLAADETPKSEKGKGKGKGTTKKKGGDDKGGKKKAA